VQICQTETLNEFKVSPKNNLKSNDFKQFTMQNGLSGRSKFPDKMKNLSCFQRIKSLISMFKI